MTKYNWSRTETIGRPSKRVKEHSDCKDGGEFPLYMSKYLLPNEKVFYVGQDKKCAVVH